MYHQLSMYKKTESFLHQFYQDIRLLLFVLILTIIYGVCFVWSEFYQVPNNSIHDTLNLFSYIALVEIGIFFVLLILSLHKVFFSITFPILTLICSLFTYYRYTANITLTPTMIDLLLVNDLRTDVSAFSLWLVIIIILTIILSLFFVWWRNKKIKNIHYYIWLPLSVFMVYLVCFCFGDRSSKLQMRMPFSFYFNIHEYLSEYQTIENNRPPFKGKVTCNSDSLIVVYIQGESLRADHLQLNGYSRATTSLLNKEKNIVSFPNVYTDYTYTHLSIPHLLTRSDAQHTDRAFKERSFISLLKMAGYYTSWLGNQEIGSTFVYFSKECDTLQLAHAGKSLEMFDSWLDEDLLPLLDDELNRKVSKHFILLHSIGSHWFYNSHFSQKFAHFYPLADNRLVNTNSHEELCNSYDNTIIYSDWFWSQIIKKLRKRKAILFYMSDHGESLGEDNNYWHGINRKEQRNIGCFIWYSDSYAASYVDKIKILRANRLNTYQSHILFHSILDAADVQSAYMEDSLDIFKFKQSVNK